MQQTTLVRIYPETKKEVDRLMVNLMTQKDNPHYTYPEFIELLVLTYKEHQQR